MYGTLLNAGDAQLDELKLATIWIVSPPDAATDVEPDEMWTPYPQNFVFWNLQHASRLIPPRTQAHRYDSTPDSREASATASMTRS